MAIFELAEQSVELVAKGDRGFVIGSAERHRHELVLGRYSVHTSAEALWAGQEEIRRIGRQLRAAGTLR